MDATEPAAEAGPVTTSQPQRQPTEPRPAGLLTLLGPLTEGIYRGKASRTSHIQAISGARDSRPHDYLYDCLTVLDTKASALLQYDGIILAAATLAITLFPKTTFGIPLFVVSLVLSGISSILCLQVIWVYWTTTGEFQDDEMEFRELMNCRNKRTLFYRASWLVALGSVVFLVLGIVLEKW
jgi:hypothetical protein